MNRRYKEIDMHYKEMAKNDRRTTIIVLGVIALVGIVVLGMIVIFVRGV